MNDDDLGAWNVEPMCDPGACRTCDNERLARIEQARIEKYNAAMRMDMTRPVIPTVAQMQAEAEAKMADAGSRDYLDSVRARQVLMARADQVISGGPVTNPTPTQPPVDLSQFTGAKNYALVGPGGAPILPPSILHNCDPAMIAASTTERILSAAFVLQDLLRNSKHSIATIKADLDPALRGIAEELAMIDLEKFNG